MKIEVLQFKFFKMRHESLFSEKKFLGRFLCEKAKLTD